MMLYLLYSIYRQNLVDVKNVRSRISGVLERLLNIDNLVLMHVRLNRRRGSV